MDGKRSTEELSGLAVRVLGCVLEYPSMTAWDLRRRLRLQEEMDELVEALEVLYEQGYLAREESGHAVTHVYAVTEKVNALFGHPEESTRNVMMGHIQNSVLVLRHLPNRSDVTAAEVARNTRLTESEVLRTLTSLVVSRFARRNHVEGTDRYDVTDDGRAFTLLLDRLLEGHG